jgi:hypothetical protein
MLMELTFKRKILNFIVGLLKVFLHPPPPLEREGLVRIVWLVAHKMNLLSIQKRDCENYLLRIIS